MESGQFLPYESSEVDRCHIYSTRQHDVGVFERNIQIREQSQSHIISCQTQAYYRWQYSIQDVDCITSRPRGDSKFFELEKCFKTNCVDLGAFLRPCLKLIPQTDRQTITILVRTQWDAIQLVRRRRSKECSNSKGCTVLPAGTGPPVILSPARHARQRWKSSDAFLALRLARRAPTLAEPGSWYIVHKDKLHTRVDHRC